MEKVKVVILLASMLAFTQLVCASPTPTFGVEQQAPHPHLVSEPGDESYAPDMNDYVYSDERAPDEYLGERGKRNVVLEFDYFRPFGMYSFGHSHDYGHQDYDYGHHHHHHGHHHHH